MHHTADGDVRLLASIAILYKTSVALPVIQSVSLPYHSVLAFPPSSSIPAAAFAAAAVVSAPLWYHNFESRSCVHELGCDVELY